MPEFRQNAATGDWVIIATDRAKRPSEFIQGPKEKTEDRPVWRETCPFCPGNEDPTLEVARLPDEGPWAIRVVNNKYPAVDTTRRPTGGTETDRKREGFGYHEVLVECPQHNACPALESGAEVARMLTVFQDRGQTIRRDADIQHLIYFKNHGERAGTSLDHPHTQLIALPLVPFEVETRIENARRSIQASGRCVYCEMWESEAADGSRMLVESEHFAAFIPFAAFSPFHTWIIPKRHHPQFLSATRAELADLGNVLYRVLRKLYLGLGDPAFNYVIRSAPVSNGPWEHFHWYLSIVLRLTRTAGFEMGTGMFINTSLPEESAEFLRAVQEGNSIADSED